VGKYDPLTSHLRRQKVDNLEMSFRDVELTIRDMLPKSAQRPQWWANERTNDSRHVQCVSWLSAGYEAFLITGADRVRFRRRKG
jgi:hypothetical protein